MSIAYAPRHAAPSAAGGWVARRFGGLPRQYWLLFCGAGLFRLGFFVIPFRTYFLSHERHLSAAQASLVMVGFGLGWALSQPIGGWCADRYGRRAVICGGAFSSAAAFLAFGSVRGFAALILAACAAGLTFDLYRPALQALTTDIVAEPQRRKQALALLYLVLNVGRGVACILAGLVAEHAFWPLFAVNAAINVAFGLVVLRSARAERPAPKANTRLALAEAVRDRRLVKFTVITTVFYLVHMQSVITLPIVIDKSGASPLAFGTLLALDPLIVAVVQLLLQHQLLNAAALRVCAGGITAVGVGLAVAGMGSGMGWFAITMPLWIAGEVAYLAVAQEVVATLAPPHLHGSYFGLWGFSQGAAALLAPLTATVLIAAGGTALLWLTGAAVAIAAALACLKLHRTEQHRQTPALALVLAQAP